MVQRRLVDGWALFAFVALFGCSSSDSSALGAGHKGTGSTGNNTGDSGTGSTSGGGGDNSGNAGDGSGATGSGATGSGAMGNGTGAGGAGASGQGTGATGTGTAGAAGSIGKIPIGTTQCSDGKDNDGDGLIDSADPECTGPLDNDESSFATGIPGDNVDPKWQDCFFDGNSGGGDDGCRYSTKCLTGELAPTDKDCTLTDQCRKFCMPLTPNGCDCFGCCAVPGPDGGIAHVIINSTCSIADIGDPKKCPTCTPSAGCENTCDRCELCLGKSSIPADCAPPSTGGAGGMTSAGGAGGMMAAAGKPAAGGSGGQTASGGAGGYCPTPACGPGQQSCGVSCLPDCPVGQYCLTGCCIPSVR